MNRFDYPNGDPESYAYDDEEQHYHEVLKELDELDKQGIPAGIDVDECDEDEDEGCMEAKQAAATKEKEARRGNKAMQKGRVPFRYTFKLLKTADPSIVFGVVYGACPADGGQCELDSQNDFAGAEAVEQAADSFMRNLQLGKGKITVQHGPKAAGALVLQSGLATGDFPLDGQLVRKGSWLAKVQLPPNIAKAVADGRLNSFSLGGTGVRVPNLSRTVAKAAYAVPTELVDLDVDDLSIVGKGANGKRLILLQKSDFENNMENVNMNETNEETNPDFELAEFEKMAVEIKKSNPGLSDEQAYTSAVHSQPELYTRYLEKLMNLQKAAQEPEFPIQKESDLPPEVANSIVILKEFVEKMGQSSNPELQGYSEVTAEILRKSAEDGIEKSEPEAFSEAVYAVEQQAPGTYANYLSRISQLHM